MLEIDRIVSADVAAPPERCVAVLADVEGYPRWASLITSASRAGERVRLEASVLGVPFEMDCELVVSPDRVVLRRIPNDAADEERFETHWTVSPGRVELHVHAILDAPGPARLIRSRLERKVADDLLADFVRAVF